MKVCPYCGYRMPDDSIFCEKCGKRLDKDDNAGASQDNELKDNPRKNIYGQLAMLLVLTALVIFDFVLGTLFMNIGWNYKIIYVISSLLYMVAVGLGAWCLYLDSKDVKAGYRPAGNKTLAMISIGLGIYILLTNLTGVLMK